MKKKILFICEANIGRSQMAEAFYNHFTQSDSAISAAVRDYRKKYQCMPTIEIIASMYEEGIDISRKKMKLLSPAMADSVEKIVVFCKKEFCPDYLLSRKNVLFQEVLDPFGTSIRTNRKVRDTIKQLVLDLV